MEYAEDLDEKLVKFLTNIKIFHPVRGLINFELFDYQKRLLKLMEDGKDVIYIKFRQGGFTTLNSLYSAYLVALGIKVGFIFKTGGEAWQACSNFINTSFINGLSLSMCKPNKGQGCYKIDTNGSSITFSTIDSLKFEYFDILFIDEADFYADQIRDCWSPLFALSKQFAIYSTISGDVNSWFKDVYNNAKCGMNGFVAFESSYHENPIYTEEYTAQLRKMLGEKAFHQEVLGEIISETEKETSFFSNFFEERMPA